MFVVITYCLFSYFFWADSIKYIFFIIGVAEVSAWLDDDLFRDFLKCLQTISPPVFVKELCALGQVVKQAVCKSALGLTSSLHRATNSAIDESLGPF